MSELVIELDWHLIRDIKVSECKVNSFPPLEILSGKAITYIPTSGPTVRADKKEHNHILMFPSNSAISVLWPQLKVSMGLYIFLQHRESAILQ